MSKKADNPKKLPLGACPQCWKQPNLCLCSDLKPAPTRTEFLILQYPQEVKNPLGTARLLSLAVPNATHRIGLSWRSLTQALGTGVSPKPGTWAVLYLGNKKGSRPTKSSQLVEAFDKDGHPVDLKSLRGVVLLDGNWKQSKSLWWRNPWLKKLPRLVLYPPNRSLYGDLRREPRRNSVSTLEAAAYVMEALEPKSPTPTELRGLMGNFLQKFRIDTPNPLTLN